ncbi:unnamed protein product, partial [Ectocarpus sp. 12 AP-2014]
PACQLTVFSATRRSLLVALSGRVRVRLPQLCSLSVNSASHGRDRPRLYLISHRRVPHHRHPLCLYALVSWLPFLDFVALLLSGVQVSQGASRAESREVRRRRRPLDYDCEPICPPQLHCSLNFECTVTDQTFQEYNYAGEGRQYTVKPIFICGPHAFKMLHLTQ